MLSDAADSCVTSEFCFFSRRAPSMTATSSFVSHRFESWEKLQNSHIPFISCCVICVFASVWDCFLLFCEYKENTEKKIVDLLDTPVKVVLLKNLKLNFLSLGGLWQVHIVPQN